MKKLNKKKIKWIVSEVTKREKGVWTIAQTQNITKQHAYKVYNIYKNNPEPKLLSCGRKPTPISEQERMQVKNTYEEFQLEPP